MQSNLPPALGVILGKLGQSLWLGVSLTFSLSLPSLADQCAYVSKETSLQAVALLDKGQVIYQFCQPCGDTTPKAILVDSLAAESTPYQNYWQVSINGQGIDLAYTYMPLPTNDWMINLAALVKCPTQGVTPVIKP